MTTTLAYDVEGRLTSATTQVGAQAAKTTTFAYDANGNRVLATYNPGASATKVYTPFPDYEVTDPPTGANVTRTTYRLGGQIAALRVNDGATNKLYYPLTDHLGNVMALSDVDGNFVSGSDARYDPFGAFTTTPTTNPSVSNLGFTGHRHNNTGANNLGLIYMNARYYLPEVGRFVSPDSIVPDPNNPQGYNRYSYVLNSPVNFTDPTGHKHCSGIGTQDVCEPQVQRPTPINDDSSGGNELLGWLKSATREIFHLIAIKEPRVQPAPYSTDPYLADLTEWLVAQMVNNAQSPFVLLLHALWTLPDQGAGTQKLIVLQLWTELVATGGVWDFKVDIQREKTFSADKQLVQLGNHVMSYQAVANIFYGFIGMQIGLDPVLLQMGAGAAQMEQGYGHWQANIDAYPAGFGDQPFDAWAIGFGFALHVQFGRDVSALTVSTFTTALDTYSASNPPLWEP